MLNDLDQATESDQDDLLNGKLIVTISRKQFYELEANERVFISIGKFILLDHTQSLFIVFFMQVVL